MTNGLTIEKAAFMQASISVKFRKLLNNLANIKSSFSQSIHEEVVKNLIRETLYFIEWIAPDIDIDSAFELANLGRFLTKWLFNWEQAWNDIEAKNNIIQELDTWSDIVVQISKLSAVQKS